MNHINVMKISFNSMENSAWLYVQLSWACAIHAALCVVTGIICTTSILPIQINVKDAAMRESSVCHQNILVL